MELIFFFHFGLRSTHTKHLRRTTTTLLEGGTMEHHQKTTKPKSIAARVFLTLIGVGFFLFGLVAITCGFVINYHDDFEAKGGGQELETLIETQFDYSQYWLGVPVSKIIRCTHYRKAYVFPSNSWFISQQQYLQ